MENTGTQMYVRIISAVWLRENVISGIYRNGLEIIKEISPCPDDLFRRAFGRALRGLGSDGVNLLLQRLDCAAAGIRRQEIIMLLNFS